MKSRKLDISLLDKIEALTHCAKGVFLELYLKANAAGISKGDIDEHTKELAELNLITRTQNYIVINDFIKFNYNILKAEHNPHKPAVKAINEVGYSFDYEGQKLIIPKNEKIKELDITSESQNSILKTFDSDKFGSKRRNNGESRLKAKYEPQNKIIDFLSKPSFALILVLFLLVAQSISSSHSILSLTSLSYPLNVIYAVSAAVLIDLLLLYFTATGSKITTGVFFVFCSCINVYCFSLNDKIEFLSFGWIVTILISMIIPFAVHSVSLRISSTNLNNS